MAVGDEKWHFPLLIGGAGVLVFLGMRSSGGGSPTVIGQIAAKDIIAQNTAVNENDTKVKLAGIGALTSYSNTRSNNETAIREAMINGQNAQAIQQMVIAGQEDLARVASSTAIQKAQIEGDTATRIAGGQESMAIQLADRQASVAKAQSKNNLWGGILSGLGSFFTSSSSGFDLSSLFGGKGGGGSSNLAPNALGIPITVPSVSTYSLDQLPSLNVGGGPYYGVGFP